MLPPHCCELPSLKCSTQNFDSCHKGVLGPQTKSLESLLCTRRPSLSRHCPLTKPGLMELDELCRRAGWGCWRGKEKGSYQLSSLSVFSVATLFFCLSFPALLGQEPLTSFKCRAEGRKQVQRPCSCPCSAISLLMRAWRVPWPL